MPIARGPLNISAGILLATALSACTTAELEAFSQGWAQGMAEGNNSYNYANAIGYGNPAYSGYGVYTGSYWTPSTFSSYSGWPAGTSYGDFVGYGECRYTGSFYTCDTNHDGFADMYGDTSDGSYSSSALRVNGRGEAFTWGENGWERNRAYDGPKQPDEIVIYDGDGD